MLQSGHLVLEQEHPIVDGSSKQAARSPSWGHARPKAGLRRCSESVRPRLANECPQWPKAARCSPLQLSVHSPTGIYVVRLDEPQAFVSWCSMPNSRMRPAGRAQQASPRETIGN